MRAWKILPIHALFTIHVTCTVLYLTVAMQVLLEPIRRTALYTVDYIHLLTLNTFYLKSRNRG